MSHRRRPPRPKLTPQQRQAGFKLWGAVAIFVIVLVVGFVLAVLLSATSQIEVEKIGAAIGLVALAFAIVAWILRRI